MPTSTGVGSPRNAIVAPPINRVLHLVVRHLLDPVRNVGDDDRTLPIPVATVLLPRRRCLVGRRLSSLSSRSHVRCPVSKTHSVLISTFPTCTKM